MERLAVGFLTHRELDELASPRTRQRLQQSNLLPGGVAVGHGKVRLFPETVLVRLAIGSQTSGYEKLDAALAAMAKQVVATEAFREVLERVAYFVARNSSYTFVQLVDEIQATASEALHECQLIETDALRKLAWDRGLIRFSTQASVLDSRRRRVLPESESDAPFEAPASLLKLGARAGQAVVVETFQIGELVKTFVLPASARPAPRVAAGSLPLDNNELEKVFQRAWEVAGRPDPALPPLSSYMAFEPDDEDVDEESGRLRAAWFPANLLESRWTPMVRGGGTE